MASSRVNLVFMITSFIAGTGWIFIPYQFQELSIELSLAIRFFFSGLFLLMIGWVQQKKISFKQDIKTHLIAGLQGVLMYSIAYLMVYQSTLSLSTGMISVVISLIVIPTTFFDFIFFKTKMTKAFYFGCILAVLGVLCLYSDKIFMDQSDWRTSLMGFFFIIFSISCTALGSNISKKIRQKTQISNLDLAAYGMIYGSFCSFIWSFSLGNDFLLPQGSMYYFSLAYLALIVGPGVLFSYLWLIDHAGPSKASLVWIIAPVVAMNISVFFEGESWNFYTASGTILVLAGSYLATKKPKILNKSSN